MRFLFVALICLAAALAPAPCMAHSFGKVIQSTLVERKGTGLSLRLHMRLDAGIVIFQPDANGDGALSFDEWSLLLGRIRNATATRFSASVDGRPAAVRFEPAGDLTPARAGINAGADVELAAFVDLSGAKGPTARVTFTDGNFAAPGAADQLDWYVRAGGEPERMELQDNFWTLALTTPTTNPGGAVSAGETREAPQGYASPPKASPGAADRLVASLASQKLSLWAVVLALGLAFALGAMHSLSPGHGKALVAAYLVGSRGRILDAVKLSLLVTASHVGGVMVLGALLFAGSSFIDLRTVHPWIGFGSGLLIFAIGYWMLAKRALHGHAHSHDHDHSHSHAHDGGHGTTSLVSLGLAGGAAPCPTAVVVLLAAVSVGRVGFGLALVGAFSLGLSLVLLLLGVMTVVASQRLSGLSRGRALFEKLPVFSAGLVMLAGVAMAFGALYQAGILQWRGL